MVTVQEIKSLVDEKIEGTGNFLVDIAIKPGNKIVILIDNENGVSISDCVKVSRHVEHNLDREKEDFELQVSSPGADQPFKVYKQYLKHLGKNVKVVADDGTLIEGKLLSVNEDGIELEPTTDKKNKKKQEQITNKHFNFNQIKETRGVISFK